MHVLRSAPVFAVLLVLVPAVICLSLATAGIGNRFAFHAVAGTCLMAGFIPLLLRAQFSFGYLIGFAFYGMITGFVWITYFSGLDYDHARARVSAIACLVAFLLPVLFLTAPLPRRFAVSSRTMDRLCFWMLAVAAAVLAENFRYGIAIVGLGEAETLRAALARPALLNYVTGAVTGALLPFAFAWFALRRRYLPAAVAILLIVSFYPALLNKTVLLAAPWLPFLFVMFRTFEPKRAVVLSLLLPAALGLALYHAAPDTGPLRALADFAFGQANIRMLAMPSLAMNYYADFFAGNPSTWFCQINLVRAFTGCPYAGQLGPIFAERYGAGNLNASLFATEGIASVGALRAPVSTFLAGLLLSVGNRVSVQLPPALVATSAGLAMQALLNVPLSVSMLTNGLLVLLLLWSITPVMADPDDRLDAAHGGYGSDGFTRRAGTPT